MLWRERTLPPYLVWAGVWFVFFVFAANVRVGTVLWDPVFRWVFVQVMAFESVIGQSGRWVTFGLVLLTYLAIGYLLWIAIEKIAPRSDQRTWKRSGLSWAALQVGAIIVIFLTT